MDDDVRARLDATTRDAHDAIARLHQEAVAAIRQLYEVLAEPTDEPSWFCAPVEPRSTAGLRDDER